MKGPGILSVALVLLLSACSFGGTTVPDAIGLPLSDAIEVVEAAGFEVRGTGVYERDPQEPTAIVVAQEPGAGAKVEPGSYIGFRTRLPGQPLQPQ